MLPCPAGDPSTPGALFEDLPEYALVLTLQRLALGDQLSARQASAALRRACDGAVHGLVARRGALPPAAWATFIASRRLVVCGESSIPWPGWHAAQQPCPSWRTQQQQQQQQQAGQRQPRPEPPPQHQLVDLPRLLHALRHTPPRATHLSIADLHPSFSPADALQLAAALAAAPAAAGLLHLELATPASLPAGALDAALRSLARLRHLSLRCSPGSSPRHPSAAHSPPSSSSSHAPPWRPALPPSLTSLTWQDPDAPHDLDLACLGRLPQLQHLALLGVGCSGAGALARLTALRSLALEPHPRSSCRLEPADLQQLALLTRLEMRGAAAWGGGSYAQLWGALAGLPSLRHLRLGTVLLLAGLQPLRGVTALQADHLVCPIAQAQAAAGCLRGCLPGLRRLSAGACRELADLARALQHHGALQSLELGSASCRGRAWCWGQACLGTLGRLREFQVGLLELWYGSGADGLLADLAGCAALEEVEVQLSCLEQPAMEGEEVALVTGQGLRAVAGGACSGSLRALHLWQGWQHGVRGVAVGEVAGALLAGDGALPRLASLRLPMCVPATWLVQLEARGLEVGQVRCANSAWDQLDCSVRAPGGRQVRLMAGGVEPSARAVEAVRVG
jgi:hypothetical protein